MSMTEYLINLMMLLLNDYDCLQHTRPFWAFSILCDGERWNVAAPDMLTKREWLKAFDTDIDSDSCVVQVDSGAESKGEAGELTPVACGVLTLRRCTPHDNNVVVTVEETDPASEFSLVREILKFYFVRLYD